MSRLKDLYVKDAAPALMKKFEYKSPMQIPRFDKVVINVGAGDAKENAKVIDNIIADLTLITSLFPAFVTSRVSTPMALMAEETIRWV